jgi:hypothetical protein
METLMTETSGIITPTDPLTLPNRKNDEIETDPIPPSDHWSGKNPPEDTSTIFCFLFILSV